MLIPSRNSAAKSPLRYPGGKSRAIGQILAQLPTNISEYREPMVGGGSVFFAVRSLFGARIRRYWLNDVNFDLYCFWRFARDENERLAARVSEMRQTYRDGRALWAYLTDDAAAWTDFERAARFFVLNRISFSGTVDSGGYSQQAFDQRFTESSIQRLRGIEHWLHNVQITHGDYAPLLTEAGEEVFIFLDPPYWSATASRLYGVNGALHTGFDHDRFAESIHACEHSWLITYDDSAYIRERFAFARIISWELQYGMNNFMQETAEKGREVFIRNY